MDEGDLRADTDVAGVAAVFTAIARGITLRARAGASPAELERTGLAAVATVCAAHGKP